MSLLSIGITFGIPRSFAYAATSNSSKVHSVKKKVSTKTKKKVLVKKKITKKKKVASKKKTTKRIVPPSAGSSTATYSLSDIASHNTADSCYTTINGSVYDVTPWINQHPGGRSAILSLCGKDGSTAFNNQHGGQSRPEKELASFKIGTLQ